MEIPAVLNFQSEDISIGVTESADMIKRYGWNRILNEINKCIVICFNCHMELRGHSTTR